MRTTKRGQITCNRTPYHVKKAANQLLCFFRNHYFLHDVPLADGINYVKPFIHFAENCMIPVEMGSRLPAMTNEELRSTGIASRMRHRKHSTVVKLILASQLTINVITGSSTASALWTTALDHKIGNYPVEDKSVIEAFFG